MDSKMLPCHGQVIIKHIYSAQILTRITYKDMHSLQQWLNKLKLLRAVKLDNLDKTI